MVAKRRDESQLAAAWAARAHRPDLEAEPFKSNPKAKRDVQDAWVGSWGGTELADEARRKTWWKQSTQQHGELCKEYERRQQEQQQQRASASSSSIAASPSVADPPGGSTPATAPIAAAPLLSLAPPSSVHACSVQPSSVQPSSSPPSSALPSSTPAAPPTASTLLRSAPATASALPPATASSMPASHHRLPPGRKPEAPCGTACTWDEVVGCWRRPDGSEHVVLRNTKRVVRSEEHRAECQSIDAEARRRLMLSTEPANALEARWFQESASGTLVFPYSYLENGQQSNSRLEALADKRLRDNPTPCGSGAVGGQDLQVPRPKLSAGGEPPEIAKLTRAIARPITRSDAYWAHVEQLLSEYDGFSRGQYEHHLRAAMEQQISHLVSVRARMLAELKKACEEKRLASMQAALDREARQEREWYERKAEKERQAKLRQTEQEDAQMQSRALGMTDVRVGVALRPQIDYNLESNKLKQVQREDADLNRRGMATYQVLPDILASSSAYAANVCWMYQHRVQLRLRVFGAHTEEP